MYVDGRQQWMALGLGRCFCQGGQATPGGWTLCARSQFLDCRPTAVKPRKRMLQEEEGDTRAIVRRTVIKLDDGTIVNRRLLTPPAASCFLLLISDDRFKQTQVIRSGSELEAALANYEPRTIGREALVSQS